MTLLQTFSSQKICIVPTPSHQFIVPRASTRFLFAWRTVGTAKRLKREENAKLTSGVSFTLGLVLTHFDVAITSLTEKYCTFPWRSDDCPDVTPQLESQQTALMRLHEGGS